MKDKNLSLTIFLGELPGSSPFKKLAGRGGYLRVISGMAICLPHEAASANLQHNRLMPI